MDMMRRLIFENEFGGRSFTFLERGLLSEFIKVNESENGWTLDGSSRPIPQLFTIPVEDARTMVDEDKRVRDGQSSAVELLMPASIREKVIEAIQIADENNESDITLMTDHVWRPIMQAVLRRDPEMAEIKVKMITDLNGQPDEAGLRPFRMTSLVFTQTGVYSQSVDFKDFGKIQNPAETASRSDNVTRHDAQDFGPVYLIEDYIVPAHHRTEIIRDVKLTQAEKNRLNSSIIGIVENTLRQGGKIMVSGDVGGNDYNLVMVDTNYNHYVIVKNGEMAENSLFKIVNENEALAILREKDVLDYPPLSICKTSHISTEKAHILANYLKEIKDVLVSERCTSAVLRMNDFLNNERNFITLVREMGTIGSQDDRITINNMMYKMTEVGRAVHESINTEHLRDEGDLHFYPDGNIEYIIDDVTVLRDSISDLQAVVREDLEMASTETLEF